MELAFKAKLWKWQGKGAWFFVSVPKDFYPDLKDISLAQGKGFGSIKVDATIGVSQVQTSIFPDNKSKTFLLPVKKSIRTENNLVEDDQVEIRMKLLGV